MRLLKFNRLILIMGLCLSFFYGGLIVKAEEMTEAEEVASEGVEEVEEVVNEEVDGNVVPSEFELEDGIHAGGVNMTQLITVDLRNMDVIDALTYLALRSGMNIVTSKNVVGYVTFKLKDIPIQDIFDVTLLSNNLAYEKHGEIIYVMTGEEYSKRYGKDFSDLREVQVFQLQYAMPARAFDLLDTLKSKVGRLLVDQETGTILLMDTPGKIKEMKEALNFLERKRDMSIIQLNYAVATEVEELLKVQIDDKKVGSVWADERSNQLIVQALPERLNGIKKMIRVLDKRTKAVLIDAKIIKIKLSEKMALGFEWEGMFQGLSAAGGMNFMGTHQFQPVERIGTTFIDDFTTIQPTDSNPPAGNKITGTEKIFFGKTSSEYNYETLFEFLETLGDTRLLSNPKLAVINNHEAKIHVGKREAYITTTTTTGQTTTTTAEEVTFVDIGLQLSITPTINEEGYITMKVKPEVSSVVDTLITPSNNKIPIVDTSMAETTVMVKDGTTIVIGGLRRDEEIKTTKRIPYLGSIPLIGLLFSSIDTTVNREELLVMITPHIITGDILVTGEIDPGTEATKPYKDYDAFQTGEQQEEQGGQLSLKPYLD